MMYFLVKACGLFPCVDTGHNKAIGYFDGRRSNIGLDSGLILSTGKIEDAVGPNRADNTTTQYGTPGDAVLSQIAGDQTFDAAILEIELIPQSDTLRFRYVFASEEYPEFVGQFNDAFAMFISGPGISGMANIALVPGPNIPVTVNNVNNGNTNTGPCTNCQYYIDNTNGSTVEFNGFTRVFTAIARVTPARYINFVLQLPIPVMSAGFRCFPGSKKPA